MTRELGGGGRGVAVGHVCPCAWANTPAAHTHTPLLFRVSPPPGDLIFGGWEHYCFKTNEG